MLVTNHLTVNKDSSQQSSCPRYNSLDPIFAPKSIAVIGATDRPGSVGQTVMRNLISQPFGGTVFPVNPKRRTVLGLEAYPDISTVPEKIDLAVIVTPAPTVPDIVERCVQAEVKGAIIISAGFKELGTAGAELEQQIQDHACRGGLRIIGPNCLGVMNPHTGLNATFATAMAQPGHLGFISQSGALGTAILDWSHKNRVGFSTFVSIGNMLDVGWGDLIDYLGHDRHTRSILIYMESIGDPHSFLSAAREVALTKPIIVLKAGRTEAAAKAAASHTGALTGRDAVLDAAFRRVGVLRVNEIADLFNMAEALAKQPQAQGSRLTILTNAGGPGVLATDALIAGGGQLADLSPETFERLNQFLPPHWSHNNPVDILGDADPGRYTKALEVAAKDPNSDGLLVILTPQYMTDPTGTAEQLKPYARVERKPVLASWMGGSGVAAGEAILNQAAIPTFDCPDTAARVFNYMWQYSYNLRSLYETPTLPADADENAPDRSQARRIIDAVRQSGRTLLTEFESKRLLATYGIPTVETRLATSEVEAVRWADKIGYPVVLKLHSETITHKTDVGGVQLDLADAAAVRQAYRTIEAAVGDKVGARHFLGVTVQPMIQRKGYELILGSSLDPQFGPVLLFGLGGQWVELFKDYALALPPLTSTLARRMMEQTRIFTALKEGFRGQGPVDLAALEQLIVRFSQFAVEQRWIKEIDLNPLLVSPGSGETALLVLDARIQLHEAQMAEEELPRPAIRPYPVQYVIPWTLKDGTPVTIRPIRPEDEGLMVKFHETLSERSVYYRYFATIQLSQRVAHERLTRICFIDYDREIALVADRKNPETGTHEILGVGRLVKLPGTDKAEFAILVSDRWQNMGLGSQFLRLLMQIGRDEKIPYLIGPILPENYDMQRVCKKLGFHLRRSLDEVVAEIEL